MNNIDTNNHEPSDADVENWNPNDAKQALNTVYGEYISFYDLYIYIYIFLAKTDTFHYFLIQLFLYTFYRISIYLH